MASSARRIGQVANKLISAGPTRASMRGGVSRTTGQRAAAAHNYFFPTSRRQYSSGHHDAAAAAAAAEHIRSNISSYTAITLLSALFGAGVYSYTATTSRPSSLAISPSASGGSLAIPESLKSTSKAHTSDLKPFQPTQADYQTVYNSIAAALWDSTDYDDGSYAPVVLRLAWHSSGTYDKASNTGGSNGGLMRFGSSSGSVQNVQNVQHGQHVQHAQNVQNEGEAAHGANRGLGNAREFLQPIKDAFPWISYGDFWTLAGVVAIQEMQGPSIPWRPGRQDLPLERSAPDGRLPDGSKAQDHVREVFRRMGFESDREFVALSGAHAVGRCHVQNSGFEGPWTYSPTVLTNEYFRLLVEESWELRDEDDAWKARGGKTQYKDKTTGGLMMLPTDMALVKDEGMRVWVEKYAKDGDLFFNDFRDVVVKLFELGVPFEQEDRFTFKSTLDDE